jgi:hypothetical protein
MIVSFVRLRAMRNRKQETGNEKPANGEGVDRF